MKIAKMQLVILIIMLSVIYFLYEEVFSGHVLITDKCNINNDYYFSFTDSETGIKKDIVIPNNVILLDEDDNIIKKMSSKETFEFIQVPKKYKIRISSRNSVIPFHSTPIKLVEIREDQYD